MVYAKPNLCCFRCRCKVSRAVDRQRWHPQHKRQKMTQHKLKLAERCIATINTKSSLPPGRNSIVYSNRLARLRRCIKYNTIFKISSRRQRKDVKWLRGLQAQRRLQKPGSVLVLMPRLKHFNLHKICSGSKRLPENSCGHWR